MKKMVVALGAAALLGSVSAVQAADGEAVYQQACLACHMTGAANAPKTGDKEAWKERIAQGNDVLYERAINGYQGAKGYMPPKGGRANLSDDDVKAAVDFIVSQSQ